MLTTVLRAAEGMLIFCPRVQMRRWLLRRVTGSLSW